ncbi:MAG: HD domain-containing phosphohydrolase [Acidobacteriota bacterium]
MTHRILVADDDALVRAILSEVLEPEGYDLAEAAAGAEVLAHVNLSPPDLIVLDLELPGGDGFSVLKALKEEESTRFIPIVVITGIQDRESRIRSLELGADDFLLKPVDPLELRARVRSLLRFKRMNDQLLHAYRQIGDLGAIAEGLYLSREPLDRLGEAVVAALLREGGAESLRPSRLWAGSEEAGFLAGTAFRLVEGRLESAPARIPLACLERALEPAGREGGLFWLGGRLPSDLEALFAPPGPLAGLAGLAHGDHWVLASGYSQDVNIHDAQVLRTLALERGFLERLSEQVRETEASFVYMMTALARAAELNDQDTGNHILRVNAASVLLAGHLGCGGEFVKWIGHSAQMHDVGKLSLPPAVLRKPGALTQEEWSWIRRHPRYGAVILGDSPRLGMAREIALCHHENWDGTGYPDGLSGEAIPLSARIVKVVDVYDALRSARPYKPALGHPEALRILAAGDARVRPAHFDPAVLACFLAHEGEILDLHRAYADVPPPSAGAAGLPADSPKVH